MISQQRCERFDLRLRKPGRATKAVVSVLVAGFCLLALFGFSVAAAATFAILFGAANGLVTIARGTVPLSLFGPAGYGRLIGRIAGPSLAMQAAAPLVLAVLAERGSDATALGFAAALALIALVCFAGIRSQKSRVAGT